MSCACLDLNHALRKAPAGAQCFVSVHDLIQNMHYLCKMSAGTHKDALCNPCPQKRIMQSLDPQRCITYAKLQMLMQNKDALLMQNTPGAHKDASHVGGSGGTACGCHHCSGKQERLWQHSNGPRESAAAVWPTVHRPSSPREEAPVAAGVSVSGATQV